MYIRMFRNHIQVERSDNNRRIVFPPTHMNILVQRISLVHNHIYPLMNRRKKERRKKEEGRDKSIDIDSSFHHSIVQE